MLLFLPPGAHNLSECARGRIYSKCFVKNKAATSNRFVRGEWNQSMLSIYRSIQHVKRSPTTTNYFGSGSACCRYPPTSSGLFQPPICLPYLYLPIYQSLKAESWCGNGSSHYNNAMIDGRWIEFAVQNGKKLLCSR